LGLLQYEPIVSKGRSYVYLLMNGERLDTSLNRRRYSADELMLIHNEAVHALKSLHDDKDVIHGDAHLGNFIIKQIGNSFEGS
jgi:thiamine kinase-like enzyme